MTFTMDEIRTYVFTGLYTPGYCPECDYFDEHAGCEPDARGYHCPGCEQPTLYGLETAFMSGFLRISDGGEE